MFMIITDDFIVSPFVTPLVTPLVTFVSAYLKGAKPFSVRKCSTALRLSLASSFFWLCWSVLDRALEVNEKSYTLYPYLDVLSVKLLVILFMDVI